MIALIRKVYLKILMHIDPIKAARKKGVKIGGGARILGTVSFGSEPWLITIDEGVLITKGVTFMTHDGSVSTIRKLSPKYSRVQKFGFIHIKKNAFVGNDAYILPNVTVGENAIVGARSVVTKDVPDNAVVAGVPAKVICTVEELAEKYLANTPKYDDWHSMQEKMKTSEMIAVYVREKKQNN